jgi:hypothetical protein
MCTKRHPARVKALQIENARAYGNGIYFALEGKTRVWRSSFALMRLPGDISLQVRSFLDRDDTHSPSPMRGCHRVRPRSFRYLADLSFTSAAWPQANLQITRVAAYVVQLPIRNTLDEDSLCEIVNSPKQ